MKKSQITTKWRKNLEGNEFDLDDCRGSFAIVKGAINKKTGERVAVKIIDRYHDIALNL